MKVFERSDEKNKRIKKKEDVQVPNLGFQNVCNNLLSLYQHVVDCFEDTVCSMLLYGLPYMTKVLISRGYSSPKDKEDETEKGREKTKHDDKGRLRGENTPKLSS